MSNAERFYFFSYWSGKEVCGRRRAEEKLCTTTDAERRDFFFKKDEVFEPDLAVEKNRWRPEE